MSLDLSQYIVVAADATPTLERDYSFGNDSSFDMSQLPMAQRTLRKMSPQKDKVVNIATHEIIVIKWRM